MSRTFLSSDELEGRLRSLGIVPVVTIADALDAAALGEALTAGGLPIAEITFRTPAAAAAISALRASHPDFLIGAGTVLNLGSLDAAIEAGADFIVSPGFNPVVVDRCLTLGVAVVPGTSSPTDIEAGLQRGLRLLKFFPAETMGGLEFLAAVSAPYGGVSFMPTGGINRQNLPNYLSRSYVAACGGSWIATENDISAKCFDDISCRATEAVAIAAPFVSNASRPTEMSSR